MQRERRFAARFSLSTACSVICSVPGYACREQSLLPHRLPGDSGSDLPRSHAIVASACAISASLQTLSAVRSVDRRLRARRHWPAPEQAGRGSRCRLDLHQQVTGLDHLEVLHRHPADVARHLGGKRRDVGLEIGVVGGLQHRRTDPPVPLVRDCRDEAARQKHNEKADARRAPRESATRRCVTGRSVRIIGCTFRRLVNNCGLIVHGDFSDSMSAFSTVPPWPRGSGCGFRQQKLCQIAVAQLG